MKPNAINANALREQGDGTKQNSSDIANHTGNSSGAQRARIIQHLRQYSSITTLEARKTLDVLHPAMRILELRGSGFRIDTVWTRQQTDCGKFHRVAKYVLQCGVTV